MQSQLDAFIHLLNHAEDIPQSSLFGINITTEPRFLKNAFPQSCIDSKIDLDRELFSRNGVLQSTHGAEKSSFPDFEARFTVLVMQADNDVGACWKADLEPGVIGYDTLALQALEDGVAFNRGDIVACLDGEVVDFCCVLFDFGRIEIRCFGHLVHHEGGEALRQRAEDAELEGREVRSVAGLAVWDAFEAIR